MTFAGVALEIAALLFALFLRYLSFKTLKKEEKGKLYILPFHCLPFCITKEKRDAYKRYLNSNIPALYISQNVFLYRYDDEKSLARD